MMIRLPRLDCPAASRLAALILLLAPPASVFAQEPTPPPANAPAPPDTAEKVKDKDADWDKAAPQVDVDAAVAKKLEGLTPEQRKSLELFRSIQWQDGPGTAELGNVAELKLPEGYRFTGKDGGHKFEEFTENPRSDDLIGVLTPKDSLDWFIVLEYDETGYIKDDEKDKIDADALLSAIRAGNEQGNKLRQARGWSEIHDIRWEQPPSYDATTHNLVWATSGESGGSRGVNYMTRVLGRRGVINVNLVTDPEQLAALAPRVKTLLSGLEYKSGWKYAEFRPGDKVAAYGLTALITGGAVAAAVKTGLFAKLLAPILKGGKAIFVGIAAVVAMIFGKRKKVEAS